MEVRTVSLLGSREGDRYYRLERRNLLARIRYARNPASSKAKAKRYNDKHRKEINLRKLAWQRNNKVLYNANQREYYWRRKVQESA